MALGGASNCKEATKMLKDAKIQQDKVYGADKTTKYTRNGVTIDYQFDSSSNPLRQSTKYGNDFNKAEGALTDGTSIGERFDRPSLPHGIQACRHLVATRGGVNQVHHLA